MPLKMKNINRLILKAYERHCDDDQPCYYGTCPVIALMVTSQFHADEKDFFMLYGGYKLLIELGER